MSEYRPRSLDFRRGMETTTNDRKRDPFSCILLQNVRVDSGSARRRAGLVVLGTVTAASDLCDFDATNDYATTSSDSRVAVFGTKFTLETLFQTDTVGADRFILGRSSAAAVGLTIKHTTTSTVVTVVTTTGGGSATMTHTGVGTGATHAYQLTRNGAAVTVKIDGVSQTGTVSATENLRACAWQIGADNGGGFYDGRIDFLRAFSTLKTSQFDNWCRLVRPTDPSVKFDYIITGDANNVLVDRGILGIHAVFSGTPAYTGAPLAVNPAPIHAIALNKDNLGARQGYVVAGNAVVPVKF